MSIPLNRIVAFAGPYLATTSGFVAAWLVAKANLLGIKGLDQANIATQVSGGLAFLVTSGLTWAGHSKWLKGHQIMLAGAVAQGKGELVGAKPPMPPTAQTFNLAGDPVGGITYVSPGTPITADNPATPNFDEKTGTFSAEPKP